MPRSVGLGSRAENDGAGKALPMLNFRFFLGSTSRDSVGPRPSRLTRSFRCSLRLQLVSLASRVDPDPLSSRYSNSPSPASFHNPPESLKFQGPWTRIPLRWISGFFNLVETSVVCADWYPQRRQNYWKAESHRAAVRTGYGLQRDTVAISSIATLSVSRTMNVWPAAP
ncbi:unnamed protein product [Blumeria hordei]|uniref:Uncharacterized protein n=1 Tax=Blumeria hordei TaxID=2867405 RepID=A0A383UNK3_BLUHO|nr:unnamed protein product [Blumeria hordei]